MKTIITKLTTLAIAVMATLGLKAEKVISINFGSGTNGKSTMTASDDTTTDGSLAGEGIPVNSWNNFSQNSGTDLAVGKACESGEITTLSGVTVSFSGRGGNWYPKVNCTPACLNGYIDDGSGSQVSVTVKGVPYAIYDVIIYYQGDSAAHQFGPVCVNGGYYSYAEGETVTATSAIAPRWGKANQAQAALGVNAIRIDSLSGSTLTILPALWRAETIDGFSHIRGTVAAVQIIESTAEARTVDVPANGVYVIESALTAPIKFNAFAGDVTIKGTESYQPTTVDLSRIDTSLVEGNIYQGWPALALATAPEGNYFAGGAGSATSHMAISFVNNGSLTLAGADAVYYLTDAASASSSTVTMKGTTVDYGTFALSVGKDTYVIEDTAVSANRLILGDQGGSRPATVTIKGTSEVTIANTRTEHSNQSPVLIGHYGSSASTLTLEGGTLDASQGSVSVGWDSAGTLVIGGAETPATLKAKAVYAQINRTNGATITVGANGTVELGAGGWESRNATVTLNGGTIKAVDNTTVSTTRAVTIGANGATIDVPEGLMLTLKAELTGAGTVTKTGAGTLALEKLSPTFTGTIQCSAGAIDLQGNRDAANITFAEGTMLKARETTADDGTIRIEGLVGEPAVEICNAVGTPFDAGAIERGEGYVQVAFTPTVSGKGCWMDYAFDGDLSNGGTDTTALSRDGSDFGPDASADYKTDADGNAYALYAGTHPYRNVTYPTEWSCAIYCSVPDYAKAALITFGTQGGGLIGLIAGTEKDQVLLVRTTGNRPYEVLATMAVPNAATAQHLYVFSKTAREIKVYLDGKLWTTYTSTSDINFGGGMQIASVHGNVGSTGIVRFDKALFDGDAENATLRQSLIGMMRLYNAVLGPKAAAALSEEFPYVSPNGLFTREVSENGTWSQTGAWTKVQESGNVSAAVPEDGAMVKLTAAAAATVEVNLDDALKTEELVIDGTAALAFTRPQAGKVANSGATTINTAVTIANQALDLAGGPLTLGENGRICFDLADYPFDTVLEPTVVALTGMTVDQGEKVTANLPQTLAMGRTAEVVHDTASQTYQLKIGFTREPGEVYLPATAVSEGAATIMNVMTYVDGDGNETLLFSDDDWIIVNSEMELTIGENLTRPAKIKVVEGGVLKLVFAEDVSKPNEIYNATVRVENGGVYDVAGKADYSHPIVLAGGTLTNSGNAITVGARQYWQMSVAGDSTIDVPANEYGSVNSGWGAHDYALNGRTLVKTGAGQYTFRTANFVGGGTLQVAAGTLILHACSVPAGAALNFDVAAGAQIIVRGNALAKTGTVTGAGTVVYENGVDTDAIYQNNGWTGTVWIKGMNWNDWDLGRDGIVDASTVKLTGVTGYAPNSTGAGCNATVELADNGDTKALTVNNGYSSGVFFFKKVIGSGTFTSTEANESQHVYKFHDVSGFTGTLEAKNNLRLVVGTGAADAAANSVVFTDGVTVNGDLVCTAEKAVFGATLKVKGSKGAVIARVTEAPDFGKVKVTLVDAEGSQTPGFMLATREVEDVHEIYVTPASFTISIR